MHYNHPVKPKELQILNILRAKMSLPEESLQRYRTLQKGYEGEILFHKLLKQKLISNCIVLYDLLLESAGNKFQLDCTIIMQREILLLEVKNFKGDFQLKNDKWYSVTTNKEISNPMSQLERGALLLKQHLHQKGYQLPIKPYLLFVNPEFTLYQCKPDQMMIHPSQINRFIANINNTETKLTTRHYKLARKMFSNQITDSPYERLPVYDSHRIKKEMNCQQCNSSLRVHGKKLLCSTCHDKESLQSAIVRGAVEFQMLFPDSKITTKGIQDWLGIIESDYVIRKTLNQYFYPLGKSRHKHFSIPDREQ